MMRSVKAIVKALLPSYALRHVRAYTYSKQIIAYSRRRIHHKYCGYPFHLILADRTGELWYDRDRESIPGLDLLRGHLLRPGARVFYLGAHQGVFSLVMAKIVGPDGTVLAVEADAQNAMVAEENRKLNRIENIQVLHAAVTEASGTVSFGLNGKIHRGDKSFPSQIVYGYSVDDLSSIYGSPQVICMDIEGYELQALKGSSETLRSHPDCLIEIHVGRGLEQFGGSVNEIISFFLEENYELFVCSDSYPYQVQPFKSDSRIIQDLFYLIAIARHPVC